MPQTTPAHGICRSSDDGWLPSGWSCCTTGLLSIARAKPLTPGTHLYLHAPRGLDRLNSAKSGHTKWDGENLAGIYATLDEH